MGLKDAVKKAAFVDILRGMSVTGTYFVVDKVTVEYPKEKLNTFPRFRGAHALLTNVETGDTKCVACMLCPTVCPSQCIRVEGEQLPDGRSRPREFEIDLGRCIYCGYCEEVCPVAAIVLTKVYELATFNKNDFILTKEWLLANQVNAHKEVHDAAVEPGAGLDPYAEETPGEAETLTVCEASAAAADGGRRLPFAPTIARARQTAERLRRLAYPESPEHVAERREREERQGCERETADGGGDGER
jgi:NADH-quinone oxidoreductase subunit I